MKIITLAILALSSFTLAEEIKKPLDVAEFRSDFKTIMAVNSALREIKDRPPTVAMQLVDNENKILVRYSVAEKGNVIIEIMFKKIPGNDEIVDWGNSQEYGGEYYEETDESLSYIINVDLKTQGNDAKRVNFIKKSILNAYGFGAALLLDKKPKK